MDAHLKQKDWNTIQQEQWATQRYICMLMGSFKASSSMPIPMDETRFTNIECKVKIFIWKKFPVYSFSCDCIMYYIRIELLKFVKQNSNILSYQHFFRTSGYQIKANASNDVMIQNFVCVSSQHLVRLPRILMFPEYYYNNAVPRCEYIGALEEEPFTYIQGSLISLRKSIYTYAKYFLS